MKLASLTSNLQYHQLRPAIQVLMETEAGKELRIVFKKGQVMKKHKTPFPIVVEIYDGAIDFGVNGETYKLKKGDLIGLEGGVPHDLVAVKKSTVRLSLNKKDSTQRVERVVNQ